VRTLLDWLALLALLLALLAVLYFGWVPLYGQHPDVPEHCNMTGRGGAARCQCPGMVARVRKGKRVACWESIGQKAPPDERAEIEVHMLEVFEPAKAKQLMQCFGDLPDHCEIVSRTPGWWGYKGKQTCQTSCKPERCGCGDSACKPEKD